MPPSIRLLATMDATAGWEATLRLREWERDHLRLERGQRLLDVGCGLGDAGLALAAGLGETGELVGIDVSSEMVAVAQVRATAARCRVRFSVGDAVALHELDGHFDVVRAARTLQWITDPEAAVAAMARVLRPGGLVSLIDTDWSTFAIDVGDHDLTARVSEAMHTERARPSKIGSQLPDIVRSCGFELVAKTTSIQSWNGWDPDESPAPVGCFSMSSLADDLIETGQLPRSERQEFVSTIHQAARDDRFSMVLTMFAVIARVPVAG